MDTESLRWFQAVADGMTITEVSELHRMSQPAVSRALDKLAKDVGAPLLHKQGRVLRLTKAGATFRRHVDALLHSLDDGVASVAELLDPGTGQVVLAFSPSLGVWLVPELVSAFLREHPKVRFELIRSDGTAGSAPLNEGRVDIELTARLTSNANVLARHLFSEPLGIALPPGHTLAGQAEIWLRDAADEPFVMLGTGRTLRNRAEKLCHEAGFEPRVAIAADDLATLRGFVANSLGVAIVPTAGTVPGEPAADGVTVIPLADSGAHREVRMLWPKDRRLLPSAELFRQFVVDTYR